MSDIVIEYFYGLCTSSIFGNLLLLDPLMPPKKCPLNCIICPLRHDQIHEKVNFNILPSTVTRNLEERLPSGIQVDGILIWGYGDPLLYEHVTDLVILLRSYLGEKGLGRKIYVHTSLLKLLTSTREFSKFSHEDPSISNTKMLIDLLDGVIIPFLWYGGEKYLLGWPQNIGFSDYLMLLKHIFSECREKLLIELYLFKLFENLYPERFHLDELLTALRYIKAKNIILKVVNRPTTNPHVKPVPESYVSKISQYLVEEGFEVYIEKPSLPHASPQWKGVATILYNHILRLPLKHYEIKALYGDLGIIALSNLISKNLVVKIPWSGDIYFVGK